MRTGKLEGAGMCNERKFVCVFRKWGRKDLRLEKLMFHPFLWNVELMFPKFFPI